MFCGNCERNCGCDCGSVDGLSARIMAAARLQDNGRVAALLAVTDGETATRGAGGHGMTAMHDAARGGNVGMMAMLCSAGYPMDERDAHGKTPAMVAVEGGHADCLRFLLESGAKVDSMDEFGVTMLMMATERDDMEMARFLVLMGADPLARDWEGRTAGERSPGTATGRSMMAVAMAVADGVKAPEALVARGRPCRKI